MENFMQFHIPPKLVYFVATRRITLLQFLFFFSLIKIFIPPLRILHKIFYRCVFVTHFYANGDLKHRGKILGILEYRISLSIHSVKTVSKPLI